MVHTASAIYRRTGWLVLSLLLSLSLANPALAQEQGEQSLHTHYFTIYYPAGEEQSAQWYAGFVDDFDTSVSELLGAEPMPKLTLHIYATEAAYSAANPMSELHPGIMAHAIPEELQVGVAVERLRKQPPELARQSFRHEMTHIVAGALSGQHLPVGFQEGLAQYNELSSSRAEDVVQAIKAAQSSGQPLLSWDELNNRATFSRDLELAYPESYTVMAYLASSYGMGAFSRFVGDLQSNADYQSALANAYKIPVTKLESGWHDWLPSFLESGWKENVLTAYDLAPGIAIYDAGHFTEARDYFSRSQSLFTDLGRSDKAGEATSYYTKANMAIAADDMATQAQKLLEAHDYTSAQKMSAQASEQFSSLQLDGQEARATQISNLANRGLSALSDLQSARAHIHDFNYPQANIEAQRAGQALASLGDASRVAEANTVLGDLWRWQQIAGIAALCAGGLCLLIGVLAFRRTHRVRKAHQPVELPKENAQWL